MKTHRLLAAFGVVAALVAHQRPCEVRDRDRSAACASLRQQTCTANDLSGTWGTNALGHEGTSLTLTRTGPITYRVAFASSGCLGSEATPCSATYRDGVLTFDRPVRAYSGGSYRRMRTILTDLGVRLISERAVERSRGMAVEVAEVIRKHPGERAFVTRIYWDTWTLAQRSRNVRVTSAPPPTIRLW